MNKNVMVVLASGPNVARPAKRSDPIIVNTGESARIQLFEANTFREFHWTVEYQVEENGPWFQESNFPESIFRVYVISPNDLTEALQVRVRCVAVDYSSNKHVFTRLLLGDFITPVP